MRTTSHTNIEIDDHYVAVVMDRYGVHTLLQRDADLRPVADVMGIALEATE